jgi:sugar-specific transcriptional regulator TrmB
MNDDHAIHPNLPNSDSKKVEPLLYAALRQSGLTESEIRLYMLSFERGPSKISTLARTLGVSRPTAYALIDRLVAAGLASDRQEGKTGDFQVESPMQVLQMLKEKNAVGERLQQDLLSSMPALLSLYHRTKDPPKMEIIEGQDALCVLHDQILDLERKEILFCGSGMDFIKMLPSESCERWIRRRIRLGVKVLVLTPEGKDSGRNHSKELREVRVLGGAPPFPTTFQIFANKLVLWQSPAFYAIVIQDTCLVDMMRATFYALWAGSARC